MTVTWLQNVRPPRTPPILWKPSICSLIRYYLNMILSRPTRKLTVWTLRKVSTRISLIVPRRLTQTNTFRLLWIFSFANHYSIPPFPPWDGMCRPALACADCAGWSGSIHYAEYIMLFFSWYRSYWPVPDLYAEVHFMRFNLFPHVVGDDIWKQCDKRRNGSTWAITAFCHIVFDSFYYMSSLVIEIFQIFADMSSAADPLYVGNG